MKQGWIDHFMGLAEFKATKSKDPSTKVGAVVVGPDMAERSLGYNGFPRGTDDDSDLYDDRETKLMRTVHAEANAIAQAARAGNSINGCTMVVNFHPCSQCAAMMINAGIVRVVCPPPPEATKWKRSFFESRSLLDEAGVEVVYVEGRGRVDQ